MRRLTLTQEATRVMLMNLRRPPQPHGHSQEALESLRAIRAAVHEAMPGYMAAFTEKGDDLQERRRAAVKAQDQAALAVLAVEDEEWADEMATTQGIGEVALVLGNTDFDWAYEHIKTVGGWAGDDDTLDVVGEILDALKNAPRVKVVGDEVIEVEDERRETTPVQLNRRQRRAQRARRAK